VTILFQFQFQLLILLSKCASLTTGLMRASNPRRDRWCPGFKPWAWALKFHRFSLGFLVSYIPLKILSNPFEYLDRETRGPTTLPLTLVTGSEQRNGLKPALLGHTLQNNKQCNLKHRQQKVIWLVEKYTHKIFADVWLLSWVPTLPENQWLRKTFGGTGTSEQTASVRNIQCVVVVFRPFIMNASSFGI